jgi:hypothetical protein
MRKFHIKVIDKLKRHISRSVTFDQKSCRLRDNVENLGTDRLATLYAHPLSPISATCPAYLSLLTPSWCGQEKSFGCLI